MDQKLPSKIGENLILYRSVNKKYKNFEPFKNNFQNLKFYFTEFKYFLFLTSKYNNFSYFFNQTFLNYLNNGITKILMHYEGQPFQNELIRNVKKIDKKNRNNRKYACSAFTFPISIFKKFIPDRIIVNGKMQSEFFIKNGWDKKIYF